jgi:hypothetical protein
MARKGVLILLVLASASIAVAATYNWPNASTSKTVYFRATDPNGDPNATINVADYDAYYLESGAAVAAKIDVNALGAANSAWFGGKGYDCGHGWVRFDVPNRCLDGGIGSMVYITLEDQTGATDDTQKDKIGDVTIQLGATVDVRYWYGGAVPEPNVSGVPEVDIVKSLGATIPEPNHAGTLPAYVEYVYGDVRPMTGPDIEGQVETAIDVKFDFTGTYVDAQVQGWTNNVAADANKVDITDALAASFATVEAKIDDANAFAEDANSFADLIYTLASGANGFAAIKGAVEDANETIDTVNANALTIPDVNTAAGTWEISTTIDPNDVARGMNIPLEDDPNSGSLTWWLQQLKATLIGKL